MVNGPCRGTAGLRWLRGAQPVSAATHPRSPRVLPLRPSRSCCTCEIMLPVSSPIPRVSQEERPLRRHQQHHSWRQPGTGAAPRAVHDRAVRADPGDDLQRRTRAMRGRAWILSLLSLCCCKADDGAKSRQPAPAVAVRETPNAAAASPDPENLPASSCERDIDFRLAGTPVSVWKRASGLRRSASPIEPMMSAASSTSPSSRHTPRRIRRTTCRAKSGPGVPATAD